MPHQLIRILGINIRDPQRQLPSCQIAELKTKKRVMAVGINGVGKSSFMRLLPLFYGASPQQILRGTGLPGMISHTLPDASSAVAYEYCRETDEDLRCVVMHCRPNEEAPQFHIIHGGYREDFFYNEQNEFVRREEFKAWVEAKGFAVTRMLVLSEYRAVILNERSMTKNGEELRRLASLHSLGPKSLRNLDQIAAAMTAEKVSFRDLKEIVIERVSDSQNEDKTRSNSRELRKNKRDVTKWLDDRDHLARIMGEKPLSLLIKSSIEKINGSHLKLCSLHVAVKEALRQVNDELVALSEEEKDLSIEVAEADRAYQKRKTELQASQQEAFGQWKSKDETFNALKRKLDRFKKIDVETKLLEHNKESVLRAELQSLSSEFQRINLASGGLTEKANSAKADIAQACADITEEISTRLLAVQGRIAIDLKALNDAEREALEAVLAPARLADIAVERMQVHSRIGELNVAIKHPQAGKEARQAREDAFDSFQTRSGELNTAKDATKVALELRGAARQKGDTANDLVRKLGIAQAERQLQLDDLEQQLTPPAGSLMAFVRQTDSSVWSELVKVINPALIKDSQLSPEILDDLLSSAMEGRLNANGVILRTAGLEQPYWVEMSEVRSAILLKKSELAELTQKLGDARLEAQKAKNEFDQADAKWSKAVASEGLAHSAYLTARGNHDRCVKVIKQDELNSRQLAEIELSGTKAKADALDTEENWIKKRLEQESTDIRQHFKQERASVEASGSALRAEIQAERALAEVRKAADLKRVDDECANELAGLGIDPVRTAEISEQLNKINVSLGMIADNKADVESWLLFQSQELPHMATDEMECSRLDKQWREIESQLSGLEASFTSAVAVAKARKSKIDSSMSSNRALLEELEGLLTKGLAEFTDFITPKNLTVDWTPLQLGSLVKTERNLLDTETEELRKSERRLRNIMLERAGPVEDWINLKKRELPDRQIVPEHIFVCLDARVLCDWFDPHEHEAYVDQINKELNGYLSVASSFVRDLEMFDRKVGEFNRDLKKALAQTESFARFKELSVNIRSGIGQMDNMSLLRTMTDMSNSKNSSIRAILTKDREIPSKEDASIVRQFRDILPVEGSLRVKLDDQVRLECSLIENGKSVLITNDVEFAAVSSNGNTALITSMFLVGFVEMVRGANSPVRLTWITDEIGRFDGSNLGAFLNTLDRHNIDVISACPSVDPALARYFPRISVFENDGGIKTTERNEEVEYVET